MDTSLTLLPFWVTRENVLCSLAIDELDQNMKKYMLIRMVYFRYSILETDLETSLTLLSSYKTSEVMSYIVFLSPFYLKVYVVYFICLHLINLYFKKYS